jgi:hypothetical protein
MQSSGDRHNIPDSRAARYPVRSPGLKIRCVGGDRRRWPEARFLISIHYVNVPWEEPY